MFGGIDISIVCVCHLNVANLLLQWWYFEISTLCVTVHIFLLLHVGCIGGRSSQITPVRWLLPITTSRTFERRNCMQRSNAVSESERERAKLEEKDNKTGKRSTEK